MFDFYIRYIDYFIGFLAGIAIGMIGLFIYLSKKEKEYNQYINNIQEYYRAEIVRLETKLGKWD